MSEALKPTKVDSEEGESETVEYVEISKKDLLKLKQA
jgi:hypothetical protein